MMCRGRCRMFLPLGRMLARGALLVACVTCLLGAPSEATAAGVAEQAAQSDLERERLELDRARLALDRDRFEHDKRAAASLASWYGWPPLGWLVAFLGTGLTWFLTRMNEREKHRREMAAVFDQDLRKGRIGAYRNLWRELKPLSLYGGGGFKRRQAAELRLALRNWYFRE